MKKILLAVFSASLILVMNEAKASNEATIAVCSSQAGMETAHFPDGFKKKKRKKGKAYGVRKQPKFRSCKSAKKIMKRRGNW